MTVRVLFDITWLILLGSLSDCGNATQKTKVKLDCPHKLGNCLATYKSETDKHIGTGRPDLACNSVDNLRLCMERLDCGVSVEEKRMVYEEIRREMKSKGVHCESTTTVPVRAITKSKNIQAVQKQSNATSNTACGEAMTRCTNRYVDQVALFVSKNPHNLTWFCPEMKRYLNCLIYSSCKLEDVKRIFLSRLQKDLKAKDVHCDFSDLLQEETSSEKPSQPNGRAAPHHTGDTENSDGNMAHRQTLSALPIFLWFISISYCILYCGQSSHKY